MSTTRSPGSTTPELRARSRSCAPRGRRRPSVDGISEREHAPLERHLLHRLLVVREADHRPPRAQPRDLRRRAAASPSRRGSPSRRASRRGRVAAFDIARRTSACSRSPGSSWRYSIDGSTARAIDVHRPHRLDRVRADRRLGGEHHRRGAVEDRVRDVARLGARRLGVLDHRLEHLRRGDHRLPRLEAAEDDLLLHAAARSRRRSRRRGRRARPSARRTRRAPASRSSTASAFSIFAITRARRAALADDLLELAHVGRGAHERERDVVDAEAERELEVDRCPSRSGDGIGIGDARQVDALVRLDLRRRRRRCSARGPRRTSSTREPDEAVVDQHVVARAAAPR